MKRILLFLLTNVAVVALLGLICSIFGVNKYLTANGLDLVSLLGFALIMGFGGSFISLLLSKTMAKMSVGARVISNPSNEYEFWLINTIQKLTQRANLPMPEVAIYSGEPNAFATGASKNSSLVAVSDGLLQAMPPEEVEAVLAHEVAHIQNGDMVTLTLIQGVVNTFVIFISRIVAFAVDSFLQQKRSDNENSSANYAPGIGFTIASFVCELVFGLLASIIVAYFSRKREFRADSGAAKLLGSPVPMQKALARLMNGSGELPQSMVASGIAGGNFMALFASHPPLEVRIQALNNVR